MANSDTKNNVSGKPASTGNFAKASGGGNTGSAVSGAHGGGVYQNGGYSTNTGGDQNQGYGDGPKFPLTTAPEVALEGNKNGGAIQGGAMQATVKDKRATAK